MIGELAERQKFFSEKAQKLKNKNLWEKRGCQVVMSARNAADWLPIVFSSIENAMSHMDWVFHFADDESTDNTLKIAKSLSKYSSAKEFNVFKYSKADTVGQAKNRIIKKTLEYKEDYPAIFLADADDFFTQERSKGLLLRATELNEYFLVGSWVKVEKGEKETRTASESIPEGLFGPWATLLHVDLIPDNGKLFYENMPANEDLLLWAEFRAAGVKAIPINEFIACYYNTRFGTVSKPKEDKKREEYQIYQNLKAHILGEKV
tara:strand:+ start:4283 stop:5071 length:789 start_codon:yes stop_codon:yes gene_type:complete